MKILLILLGSPVWLPILIAVFAVVFSVIISLWAVVVSLWVSFAATIVSAPAAVIIGILNVISGSAVYGAVIIVLGFLSGVAAFILFYISLCTTRGVYALTRKSYEAIASIKL